MSSLCYGKCLEFNHKCYTSCLRHTDRKEVGGGLLSGDPSTSPRLLRNGLRAFWLLRWRHRSSVPIPLPFSFFPTHFFHFLVAALVLPVQSMDSMPHLPFVLPTLLCAVVSAPSQGCCTRLLWDTCGT